MKKPQRKGFTIIEVSLVLAISGLLLVGIISSTNGAIARQRYNDSVQNVAEQLRSYYSQVSNPQGVDIDTGTSKPGASSKAFYGKLLVFGETNSDGASLIKSYTVIGDAEVTFTDGTARDDSASPSKLRGANLQLANASTPDIYTAPWQTVIQKPKTAAGEVVDEPYSGSILILHSANGGVVHTYATDITSLSQFNQNSNSDMLGKAVYQEVNLCIESPDRSAVGDTRRNIRIAQDGHNSTAISLIDLTTDESEGEINAC